MGILNEWYQSLNESLHKINNINQKSGALARYEEYKTEIKCYGWDYIEKKYNTSDTQPEYEFYKFVYDNMVEKGELA